MSIVRTAFIVAAFAVAGSSAFAGSPKDVAVTKKTAVTSAARGAFAYVPQTRGAAATYGADTTRDALVQSSQ
jgi:hypothetical protein